MFLQGALNISLSRLKFDQLEGNAVTLCGPSISLISPIARFSSKETAQDMFMRPLYQQHAPHTLASRACGPQPHMRS